jgi:hypothetical protein
VITHIVMFRWKDDLPEGQLAAIAAALDGLPPAIPSIRTYRHGSDLGVSAATNLDYAIVATFDDVDGWRQYDKDPVHEAARTDVIRPWIAERQSVQFET